MKLKKFYQKTVPTLIALFIIHIPLFETSAQNQRILITKGAGTFTDSKKDPIIIPFDLTNYQRGHYNYIVKMASGDGISNSGGRCGVHIFVAKNGEYPGKNIRTLPVGPGNTGNLGGDFEQPGKFILVMLPDCFGDPKRVGEYAYEIYLENGEKIPGNSFAASSAKCGLKSLPPVSPQLTRQITELKDLNLYYKRFNTYSSINRELQIRNIKIGFFGAASVVTANFSLDLGSFDPPAQKFLDELSKELTVINSKYAMELLITGALEKENKSGCITIPEEIDAELIRREQEFAENKLAKSPDRKKIVDAINFRTKDYLDGYVLKHLAGSIMATQELRITKRKSNPNAEFNYGSKQDREEVGKILAKKFRNKSK